jgi:hypothetical protein
MGFLRTLQRAFLGEKRIRAKRNGAPGVPWRHAEHVMTHIFFHPDCTVGPGFSPDLLTLHQWLHAGARGLGRDGHTAGGESHPAPKTYFYGVCFKDRHEDCSRAGRSLPGPLHFG